MTKLATRKGSFSLSSLEGKQSLTEEFTKESLVALFDNSKGVYLLHARGDKALRFPSKLK